MKKLFSLLFLLLLLTGCASVKEHTVSFWNGDKLLFQQTLPETEMPAVFTPGAPAGLRFVGWQEEIVPEQTDYHALFVPVLDQHVPYLFADEEGFLRPNALLTGRMLKDALFSLADPAAKKYFPEIPDSDEPLSPAAAAEIMEHFFPDKAVEFRDPLNRAAFAAEINTLLDRQFETIQPTGMGFPDMHPESPDYAELVEAAVSHEEGTVPVKDVLLDTGWSEGWHLINGKLFLADEYGCLAVNTNLNGFQFDENGSYTSGNEELDSYVTALLASFQEADPEAIREDLLHVAYEYCRDKFMYLNREAYEVGATGWEIKDAITMLSTGKGNCYKYTSAFWALARGLGYDAMAVAGMINVHPHAWVIIHLDDVYYYCDPELEMAGHAENHYDWNLFMRERDSMKSWDYGEPEGLIIDPPPIDPSQK